MVCTTMVRLLEAWDMQQCPRLRGKTDRAAEGTDIAAEGTGRAAEGTDRAASEFTWT